MGVVDYLSLGLEQKTCIKT